MFVNGEIKEHSIARNMAAPYAASVKLREPFLNLSLINVGKVRQTRR